MTRASTTVGVISTTSGGDHSRRGTHFQSFAEFFHGSLDEVSIFDGALTTTDVAALAAVSPGTIPTPLPAGLWLLAPAFALVAARRRGGIAAA